MFTISTLLGHWLSILYTVTLVPAHGINNVTVTTTSTLVVSVFNFAPTTHLTPTYPNTSIPALTATPPATTNLYLSEERYQPLDSPTLNIQTATTAAPPTSTVAYEKEDKEGDDHESHPHTTPPPQSKVTKPAWFNPSTAALLCYDVLATTFFVWCWVMGWFSWLNGDQDCGHEIGRGQGQAYRTGEARDSSTRALVNQNVEWEMRRLGMV